MVAGEPLRVVVNNVDQGDEARFRMIFGASARTVTPAERPEAVGQILNDIPLPPDLDLQEVHAIQFQPIYIHQQAVPAIGEVTGSKWSATTDP